MTSTIFICICLASNFQKILFWNDNTKHVKLTFWMTMGCLESVVLIYPGDKCRLPNVYIYI